MTNPPSDNPGEMQPVIDVAQLAVSRNEVADDVDLLSVVLPNGAEHEVVDLEKWREQYRDHPRRKRGTVHVFDADSFVAYYRKHFDVDASEVYADAGYQTLLAVLNAHGPVEAGWADHRLALQLRQTPEWKHWAGRDRTAMTQVAFAEHIEDDLTRIVEPAGATMLELAETFNATTKVTFGSASRLKDGQRQLTYIEETDASAGRRGEITIPAQFTLALAPFEGVAPYKVTARLRYRINGEGRMALTYLLDRPEDVLRAAFGDVLAKVEEALGSKALHGVPA